VTEHILNLLHAARRTAALTHRNEPFAQQRRVYREFEYFDDLLAGRLRLEEVKEVKEVKEVGIQDFLHTLHATRDTLL
jgi:hypothetical protein